MMKIQITKLCALAYAAVVIALSGCTSIKTRPIIRSSDGKFSAHCLPKATKGVPCKFKVESGVRGEIQETIFIDPTTGQVAGTGNRIYDVSLAPVYTDQVFTVHIPRPLAGTLDLTGEKEGYQFNADGYLHKIGATIDDTTIEDITTALGEDSLGGFLKGKKTAATVSVNPTKFIQQTRTIAVREFSYGNPNWEIEMNDWVNQYQYCNTQCGLDCQVEEIAQDSQDSREIHR
jgi:hypothetical protein